MASDLSGNAYVGSGYGGGGAGAGEYRNEKFCNASAGADGIAYIIEVRLKKCVELPRVLVNHNNANHKIACIKNAPWCNSSYKSLSLSKMTLNMDSGITTFPSRSFTTEPNFQISDNLNNLYLELKNIGNWSGAVLCDSKVKHNNDVFKTLYFTDENPESRMYVTTVVNHTFTRGSGYSSITYKASGTTSSTTTPDEFGDNDCDALYLLCLAQGGGGGGGGADNEWKLFNSAYAGGGGGGGGAICTAVYVPAGKANWGVSVGAGGPAGSTNSSGGTAGSGGFSTYIDLYPSGKTSPALSISADGGYGGGNGNGGTGGGGSYGGGYASDGGTGFSFTTLYICYGGAGGGGGSNGSGISWYTGNLANNINGSSLALSNANLYSISLTGNRSGGSAGNKTSGEGDAGGGGGASLLGNGGSY